MTFPQRSAVLGFASVVVTTVSLLYVVYYAAVSVVLTLRR